MDTVGSILIDKGSAVHSTPPEATVLAAVERMCREQIGALLVCEQGHPVGIITERDLMTRVILERRDPSTALVREVMSTEVAFVEPGVSSGEAMAIMTERRCRHLPVVREQQVVGLVSIGDLVRQASRKQEFEIRVLTDYICGKYPG
jgi:CBS domain-containing protein